MTYYFDNAASTKCDTKVVQKMIPFFETHYANPSAYHLCGREACDAMEIARYEVANYLSCAPTEIVFTSGATEANNLAIKSCAILCEKKKPYNFIISEIEHKSVLNIKDWLKCEGYETRIAKILPSGVVDLEYLMDLVDENTLLISCMNINNETGIIQPVEQIGEFCREEGILFHVDATQLFGKYEVNAKELGADFITASAHKFHGPKGSGVLYKNRDIEFKCLIEGGSQEGGFRAGTENVPGIVGFGEALKVCRNFMGKNFQYMLGLEKYFLHELEKHNVHYQINGDLWYKSPWIFNINFGINADLLIDNMPEFCFSKSSACSKNFKPSHVLAAMSVDDEDVKSSIRLSFSKYTTENEINDFVIKIKELQDQNL